MNETARVLHRQVMETQEMAVEDVMLPFLGDDAKYYHEYKQIIQSGPEKNKLAYREALYVVKFILRRNNIELRVAYDNSEPPIEGVWRYLVTQILHKGKLIKEIRQTIHMKGT